MSNQVILHRNAVKIFKRGHSAKSTTILNFLSLNYQLTHGACLAYYTNTLVYISNLLSQFGRNFTFLHWLEPVLVGGRNDNVHVFVNLKLARVNDKINESMHLLTIFGDAF